MYNFTISKNKVEIMDEVLVNKSFLIVDDNKEANNMLADILKLFGSNVDSSYDGLDALEKVRKSKYDLVITDIKMPNMNGLELIDNIEKINNETKIIILSSYTQEFINNNLKPISHTAISKPFQADELFENIQKILLK